MGDNRSKSDIKSSCDPITEIDDVDRVYYDSPYCKWDTDTNQCKFDDSDKANPCGLIAKSAFNDTFTLLKPNGDSVKIHQHGINWDVDRDDKFDKNDDEK